MEITKTEKERIIRLGNGDATPTSPQEVWFVKIRTGKASAKTPQMKEWCRFWRKYCTTETASISGGHRISASQEPRTRFLSPIHPAHDLIKELEGIVKALTGRSGQSRIRSQFEATMTGLQMENRVNKDLFSPESVDYVNQLIASFSQKMATAGSQVVRGYQEEKGKKAARSSSSGQSTKKKKKKRRSPSFEEAHVVFRGGLPGSGRRR